MAMPIENLEGTMEERATKLETHFDRRFAAIDRRCEAIERKLDALRDTFNEFRISAIRRSSSRLMLWWFALHGALVVGLLILIAKDSGWIK